MVSADTIVISIIDTVMGIPIKHRYNYVETSQVNPCEIFTLLSMTCKTIHQSFIIVV